MSLSKYYQNSSSFQPENLIKREEDTSSGWQPLHPGEQTVFQSESLPIAQPNEHSKDSAPQPTAVPDSPVPSDPAINTTENPVGSSDSVQQSKLIDDQQAPPTLIEEIDLSNYLERDLAEQQIEEAYQKGLLAGQENIEQEFDSATKALLISCQQLDTIRETIITNISEEMQEFALAIAERIIRFSVREQDSTIVATIEEALQRSVKSDDFTVYVHPDDYDCVFANSAEIIAGFAGLNKIVVKKDITVERGGAKIESDNCTIDATVASQFELIREEIKKNL